MGKDFKVNGNRPSRESVNQTSEQQRPSKEEQIRFISLDRSIEIYKANPNTVDVIQKAKEIESYLNSDFQSRE